MLKKRAFFAVMLQIIITLGLFLYLITFCKSYSLYIPSQFIQNPSDIQVSYSQEGIVAHSQPVYEKGYIKVTFHALNRGETVAEVCAFDGTDGQSYYSQFTDLRVRSFHILTNGNFRDSFLQDFSGYPVFYMAGALFFGIMVVYMAIHFKRNLKENICSYSTVFDCSLLIVFVGLALLFTALSAFLLVNYRAYQLSSMHYLTSLIMLLTILVSTPFVLVYSISLSVSNLSLIRHEGFRFANILGILLSIVMTVGVAACIIGPAKVFTIDSRTHVPYALLCTFYVFGEMFLLGTRVCTIIAARHRPAYDKDYILILGCGIRKDGSLTPLLKGRVDKALEFYYGQLQATGKKAVFVPSGGQGNDEVISEGEAMQRYLLAQGIPQEQIMAETKSANTLENMTFSRALIADSSAKVAFSTTNYHVFRSGIYASRAGLQAEGMGSKTKWYFWPNAFIREFIGMIVNQRKNILVLVALTLLIVCGMAFLTA